VGGRRPGVGVAIQNGLRDRFVGVIADYFLMGWGKGGERRFGGGTLGDLLQEGVGVCSGAGMKGEAGMQAFVVFAGEVAACDVTVERVLEDQGRGVELELHGSVGVKLPAEGGDGAGDVFSDDAHGAVTGVVVKEAIRGVEIEVDDGVTMGAGGVAIGCGEPVATVHGDFADPVAVGICRGRERWGAGKAVDDVACAEYEEGKEDDDEGVTEELEPGAGWIKEVGGVGHRGRGPGDGADDGGAGAWLLCLVLFRRRGAGGPLAEVGECAAVEGGVDGEFDVVAEGEGVVARGSGDLAVPGEGTEGWLGVELDGEGTVVVVFRDGELDGARGGLTGEADFAVGFDPVEVGRCSIAVDEEETAGVGTGGDAVYLGFVGACEREGADPVSDETTGGLGGAEVDLMHDLGSPDGEDDCDDNEDGCSPAGAFGGHGS
jgi:hypothetical protein